MANPLFTDDLVTSEFCTYLNEKLLSFVDSQFVKTKPVTGKGFQNIVHILENNCNMPVAVLRIFSSPLTAKNEILCLNSMTDRVANNGLKLCPKIYFSEEDNSHIPFSYLVQEFIPGDTLTRGDIHNNDFIRDAALLLHEIHTIEGPPATTEQLERDAEFWPGWAVKLVSHVPQSHILYMEVKERLETHLADLYTLWKSLPRTNLIHGDPNVGNFMRTRSGELRLLDWEMSGSNHRLVDVAAFITSNELTTAEEALFLHTYYSADSDVHSSVESTSHVVPTTPEEVFRQLPTEKYKHELSLLWLFKVRRLFALIAYFVMLFSKTPVLPETEEKRVMLQTTLDSFVTMFAECVNRQLVVECVESEIVSDSNEKTEESA